MNNCICGGPLVPCRINIMENGVLRGTVCFKLFCPKCRNSQLDSNGKVIYFSYMGDGTKRANYDILNFWVPDEVKYHAKEKFIRTILSMCDNFTGHQYFTMEQIRNAYREGNK